MAVDRNTVVTLHKKGESNSCIAKKQHIRRETVWKVVKNSRKLVKHATDQARAENERSERSVWWKLRGKRWEGIHVVLLQKWLQKQESVKLQCVESSKKTPEPILAKWRKGMNFQPLMNVRDLADVNTFWISCPIWRSLMRRILTFSNA